MPISCARSRRAVPLLMPSAWRWMANPVSITCTGWPAIPVSPLQRVCSGKCKIHIPERGIVEFQLDSFFLVIPLQGFKGGFADALITVDAEGTSISNSVTPPFSAIYVPLVPIILQRASMKQDVLPLARTTSTPSSTSDLIHSIASVSIRRVGSVRVPSTSVRSTFNTA